MGLDATSGAHVLLCVSILATPAVAGSDWPQYRGPNGDGTSTEIVFSNVDAFGLGVTWKVSIGSGYSGVSIADGRVVTMFSDGTTDVAAAFDEASGRALWRFEVEPTYRGQNGAHDGPMATPVIEGGKVFGLGARGRLFALDLETGKLSWATDLVADHGARPPFYGFATSPMIQDDVLVVEIGAEDAAVAGFDPSNGERKWSAGIDAVNYQSPIPFEFGSRRQVLFTGLEKLYGLDAASGEVLWEHAHGGTGWRGARSIVPVPSGEGRIFLAYKDDASALLELDHEDGVTVARRAWEERSIRNTYNVPVYHDGYLYSFSSRFLTSVDAATGKPAWRSRPPGDGMVTLVDRHLVIQTKKGSLHVVRASPEGYEQRASLDLFDDLAWTPPSFANGHIFVRSLGELARVEIRREQVAAVASSRPQARDGGSRFAAFLTEVQSASDSSAVVDQFLASIETYPLIEGDSRVHFLYRGPGEDLAVGGDMIGARQERTMTRVADTDLLYYSTTLEPGARVNYVFIRDYDLIMDPLNPRTTASTVYLADMEMNFESPDAEIEMSWVAMPGWEAPAYLDEAAPERQGRIETRRLESARLGKQLDMDVYLPAGYDTADQRYPVVFVHAGRVALRNGRLPTILDNLAGERMAPVIAVFVHELPDFFNGAPYVAMFAEELIPWVDENYRTLASPDQRASIGGGWGGLTALSCTFGEPGTVGKVGAHSVFMLDFQRVALESRVAAADDMPLDVYLDWGMYDPVSPDEAWDMRADNEHLAGVLRQRGYSVAGGESPDGPGWSTWRTRTGDMLETLFPVDSTQDE